MNAKSSTTLPIRVRPATLDDLPSMLSLEQAAPSAAHWPPRTYEETFQPEATARIVLVADLNGTICGFIVARIGAGECELENIVVAEAQRRGGIGHKLLRALITAAREKSAAHLLLEVRESNRPARCLYEGCGFTLSSRRRNYYSNPPEDALNYALPL